MPTPVWLARLVWRCRRKRLVLLHLDAPPGKPDTYEGILLGRWGGHYVLLLPKVVNSPTETISLEGALEVPAERVILVQRLQ